MLVSLVMAVHNGEKFLKEALEHALAQTYSNLEIIIVNDGSTDTTKYILDQINDFRVRVIHLDKNLGAANALNIGINEARGEWIAIQDADDNSYPSRIEEQVKYFYEHQQLIAIGTLINCISGNPAIPDIEYEGLSSSRNANVLRNQIRKVIYWGCPLTHSSVMFAKKAFQEVGGYNPEFKIAYDYDLWLKLLEKGDIEKVPKVLLEYRILSDSLSNKNGLATVNEMQIASSRAIFRAFYKEKQRLLKIILIGSQKGCENYQVNIAPLCGLQVAELICKNRSKKVPAAVRKIKAGEIDVIIVLDDCKKKKTLRMLGERGLKLNKHVYLLFNILE